MTEDLYTFLTRIQVQSLAEIDEGFLVNIHPANDVADIFVIRDTYYGIYVMTDECRKLTKLVGQITVIRPLEKEGIEGGCGVKGEGEI
ncbi:MAG: hypothetical protein JSW28_09975 [Thermoplasmata archaeon]|nr:MAG: hypothetical protein JSW28_09975 [Thermoplasmata archaeon]